jgi:alpha-1,2-glucosyltransferase
VWLVCYKLLSSEFDLTCIDFFWCAISIAVSAIANPIYFIKKVFPYLALLATFGGFVVWNGGVVLGGQLLVHSCKIQL